MSDTQKAKDEQFIRKTFELAIAGAQKGLEPFAALLVKNDTIQFSTEDRSIEYSDPTAHAELLVISEFCRTHQLISLEGYTLYCNVEPCVMCSGAIHWSKVSRVVFSVHQHQLQTLSKGKPKPDANSLINTGKRKTEITGGIIEQEGLNLLNQFPFTSKKEKHKAFHG